MRKFMLIAAMAAFVILGVLAGPSLVAAAPPASDDQLCLQLVNSDPDSISRAASSTLS